VNQIFIGIFHLQLAWAIVLTQLLVFMAWSVCYEWKHVIIGFRLIQNRHRVVVLGDLILGWFKRIGVCDILVDFLIVFVSTQLTFESLLS
jgi:hypothetical protein